MVMTNNNAWDIILHGWTFITFSASPKIIFSLQGKMFPEPASINQWQIKCLTPLNTSRKTIPVDLHNSRSTKCKAVSGHHHHCAHVLTSTPPSRLLSSLWGEKIQRDPEFSLPILNWVSNFLIKAMSKFGHLQFRTEYEKTEQIFAWLSMIVYF